ncbi:hypothetical protein F511_28775 [Dorcoceras hygrometricum]|uniref:Uncharacterized protein n=1 Tax=Dorcoceras hygrometricum TaxID=472368 RepID=A0A2Z7CHC4_9LAMI|nr:hypothetical protein F511_28775 [Dorcoceras hygrometricum]
MSLVSGRGPDWRLLSQSTEKSRRYCNYGWIQTQVPARIDRESVSVVRVLGVLAAADCRTGI